jgi:hypothetical protein
MSGVDIRGESNTTVSQQSAMADNEPEGRGYHYVGATDTGTVASFIPTTKATAAPKACSASAAARTDAALASMLAAPIRSQVRVKLGR